jgi:hypothetical protein
MPRGEGHGLVVEEQEGVVMGLPLLLPAAPELQFAHDPQLARVETRDLVAFVQATAVARPRPAQRRGDDVAERRDPVALWNVDSYSWRTGPSPILGFRPVGVPRP